MIFIFDYNKKTGKITLNSSIHTTYQGAVEALPFPAGGNPYSSVWCNCVFITFTISTHEYPRIKLFDIFILDIDGNNLPFGLIDERRHLEIFGKSVSGLCRVTSPFTPPPIRKRHAELRAVFVLVGAVGLEPMTSTMSR